MKPRKMVLAAVSMGTLALTVWRVSYGKTLYESGRDLAALVVVARGGDEAPSFFSSTREATAPKEGKEVLMVSNEYERRTKRSIGEGLMPLSGSVLVDVWQRTRHEVSTGEAFRWSARKEGASEALVVGEGSVFEVEYPAPGRYVVEAVTEDAEILSFSVTAKRVRRELRSLSVEERERYLDAMQVLYATDDDEGKRLYGPDFQSMNALVIMHLLGAADRDCDHYHDDAGFLNHHVGITWAFEKALVAVDPRVAAHYWDYTLDANILGKDWRESFVFDDNWFGPANPANDDHIVDRGRWAYTEIPKNTSAKFRNAYGLLRSPWNTNKTPYLTRSSYTLNQSTFDTFPECQAFESALFTNTWIGTTYDQLNGGLHGPVHIMVGGYWGLEAVGDNNAVAILLFAKFLWRLGYLRCPTFCAQDAPQSDCRCECPTSLRKGRSAFEVLNVTGGLHFLSATNVSYDLLLDTVCSVGFPGELFTSAAPQDPIFWPIHGEFAFSVVIRSSHNVGRSSVYCRQRRTIYPVCPRSQSERSHQLLGEMGLRPQPRTRLGHRHRLRLVQSRR